MSIEENFENIAKSVIEELEKQNKTKLKNDKFKLDVFENLDDFSNQIDEFEELAKTQNLDFEDEINKIEISNFDDNKILPEIQNLKDDEIYFLEQIKERILVLFEGLNSFDSADIEARVELNLKFMEFLLASIENRLENLSK